MSGYLPDVMAVRRMDALESSGEAEVLRCEAAEEEFGRRFRGVRSNQLVAKVTVTRYYRRTQFGYQEIPTCDMGGKK